MQKRQTPLTASDDREKLYEKHSPHGVLSVYQTTPHGKLLTLNDEIILSEEDGFFFHEMLAHPVLFSHPCPRKVAIVGASHGILQEVLKHPSVESVSCMSENPDIQETVALYFSQWAHNTADPRVRYHAENPFDCHSLPSEAPFDVIIQTHQADSAFSGHYPFYHSSLAENGMLVQPFRTSLIHYKSFKSLLKQIRTSGFEECQSLTFPQPSHPEGSRTVFLAIKLPALKCIREKDIYNRGFATRYYNLDTHKAALAMPEYVRQELEELDYFNY